MLDRPNNVIVTRRPMTEAEHANGWTDFPLELCHVGLNGSGRIVEVRTMGPHVEMPSLPPRPEVTSLRLMTEAERVEHCAYGRPDQCFAGLDADGRVVAWTVPAYTAEQEAMWEREGRHSQSA
jgi:hypothetical protein